MSLRRLIVALAFAASPVPALAQYQMISPMLYNGPRISLENHARVTAEAMPAMRGRAVPAALTYRPDAARRRANLAGFVAKTCAADAACAQQLRGLLADDFFGKLETAVAAQGLHVNNLADAYSLYWIAAWQATRGHNDNPSPAKLRAVQTQAAGALRAAPELAGAGDAAKQQMAEALWIQAVMIDAAVEQAKGNPQQLQAIRTAATAGAQAMGLDLARMQLTETGFTQD